MENMSPLTGLEIFGSGFYKDVAPTALGFHSSRLTSDHLHGPALCLRLRPRPRLMPFQSARGLAHSRTLRAVRGLRANAMRL